MKLTGILQIAMFVLIVAAVVFRLLGWPVALTVAFALAIVNGIGLIALAILESKGPGGVV